VAVTDLGDAVRITVEDDGLGMPDGFRLNESRSLGLQITRTLVTDDLKGHLDFEAAHQGSVEGGDAALATARGTRAIVTFPKRAMSATE
jgi:two-component system, sensor histidine kinase PdtaS